MKRPTHIGAAVLTLVTCAVGAVVGLPLLAVGGGLDSPADLCTPGRLDSQAHEVPTILGPSALTYAELIAWWDAAGRGRRLPRLAVSVDDVLRMYVAEGDVEGVRGDLALAQAIHETGWFVIHPDSNEVEVRPTKRPRSKATISLHADTVAALWQRHAQQASERLAMGSGRPGPKSRSCDLVFTWADGRLMRPDTLTRIIDRMSTAAGLPRLTPHGLRHSFATAALKARVPVEVVAARLGNTTRVVQEIYAHVIPSDDQAAAQLVGDLYRAPATGGSDPRVIPSDGEEDDAGRHEASAS